MRRLKKGIIFMLPRVDCCCKGCSDRVPACHDTCERYMEYKKWLETVKSNRKYFHSPIITDDLVIRRKRYASLRKFSENIRRKN